MPLLFYSTHGISGVLWGISLMWKTSWKSTLKQHQRVRYSETQVYCREISTANSKIKINKAWEKTPNYTLYKHAACKVVNIRETATNRENILDTSWQFKLPENQLNASQDWLYMGCQVTEKVGWGKGLSSDFKQLWHEHSCKSMSGSTYYQKFHVRNQKITGTVKSKKKLSWLKSL